MEKNGCHCSWAFFLELPCHQRKPRILRWPLPQHPTNDQEKFWRQPCTLTGLFYWRWKWCLRFRSHPGESLCPTSGRRACYSNHIRHVGKAPGGCCLDQELFQLHSFDSFHGFLEWWRKGHPSFGGSLRSVSQAGFLSLRMVVKEKMEMFPPILHDLFCGDGLAVRSFQVTSRWPERTENLGPCIKAMRIFLVCEALEISGFRLPSGVPNLSEVPLVHLRFLFEAFLGFRKHYTYSYWSDIQSLYSFHRTSLGSGPLCSITSSIADVIASRGVFQSFEEGFPFCLSLKFDQLLLGRFRMFLVFQFATVVSRFALLSFGMPRRWTNGKVERSQAGNHQLVILTSFLSRILINTWSRTYQSFLCRVGRRNRVFVIVRSFSAQSLRSIS